MSYSVIAPSPFSSTITAINSHFSGESVMNDAVALVLSKSVETYSSVSSEAGKKAFNTAAFFAAVLNFIGE